VPLNPDFLKRARAVSDALDQTPFTVLIWGPGIPAISDQGRKRERLKAYLAETLGPGASVLFSEDLAMELAELTERGDLVSEYVQLRSADAVVLIPESIGAITESALFSPELRSKCIAFVQRREKKSFGTRAYSTLKVEWVETDEWKECNRVTQLAN
jgi:hypothetical protein